MKHFTPSKNFILFFKFFYFFIFFFCIYKIYLISAEGYKNAGVNILIIKKTGEIWVSMKNIHDGLGVKNMSDLILKEIHRISGTKISTKKQIKKYKMTERKFFEKYANLSEDKLNTKSSKNVYVKNDVMSTVINVGEVKKKKRGEREINGFRKKLMIPKFEIPECPEHEGKSKIRITFVNEKILEEYSLKIYEIDPYFYEHYKEKI